ncbi:MAG: TonB-dependent receptor [Candidatus Neomarinimicrobiota bacterium]
MPVNFKLRLFTIIITMSAGLRAAVIYTDTLKVFPFDPVVVTGSRTAIDRHELPVAITVIPEVVVKARSETPLLDLVAENVPGLFVTKRTNLGYGVSSGSGGQITMRGIGGFPNTQVLVLIDGRPDIMGLFGHPLSDVYFGGNVKKIEVLRGPASLLYGSNAMGGAINIITNHKSDPGYHLRAPLRIGSFNSQQLNLHQSFEHETWGISANIGAVNSDGYRTDGRDDYGSQNGTAEAHWQISQDLRADVNAYFTNLEVYDPGRTDNPFTNHRYNIKRRGGDLTLNHTRTKLTSDLKLHYNFGHHDINDPNKYLSDDNTAGLILAETYQATENARVMLGFDLRQYGGRAWLDSSWKEHDVSEQSVIAQYNQKFFSWLNLDGGLRYTRHSIAGTEWIPAIGAALHFPRDWHFKLQYARGYRNPTINELYLFTPSTTDLKPEISTNLEFIIEKEVFGWLSTGLSVYQTKAENLIEKGFVSGRPLYQNQGETLFKGVEWEGQMVVTKNFSSSWTMSVNSASRKVGGMPGQKFDLSLRYNPLDRLRLTLQSQWINNLYSVENPYGYGAPVYKRLQGYWLLNWRSSIEINRNIDLTAEIENLTDTEYETMYHYPLPGRTFWLGITIKY